MSFDIGTAYLYGISGGSVNRESVMDMITNTDPFDTPLLNLAPKVPARHTTEEWLNDSLAATSIAGRPEGQAFSADDITAASRTINITQIFAKHVMVSETQQTVSPYGFSDTFLYEVMKGTREVMRNIENKFFGASDASAIGDASVASVDGTARSMKTLDDFLQTNALHAAATELGGTGSGATAVSLAESGFNAFLQTIYVAGGNPGWVFTGPVYKRMISGWNGSVAAGGSTPQVQLNASDRAIGRAVNSYLSDFGMLNIVLDRWTRVGSGNSAVGRANDAGRAGTIYALELQRVQVAWLRPLRFRRLAADGDRVRGMVIGELTLKVLAEGASGRIFAIDESVV